MFVFISIFMISVAIYFSLYFESWSLVSSDFSSIFYSKTYNIGQLSLSLNELEMLFFYLIYISFVTLRGDTLCYTR